jgi:2-methylcitrate dehydratase PrpD
MANAMGAAYAQCAGNILSTSDGTWDVWLNAGIGARGGMLAAELASRGHQGAHSPLLGEFGLYSLYFRGEYHAEALLSELGSKFESGNVSIKPYSSCKGTHHAIYTALELVSKNSIAASAIKAIQVDTSDYNMRIAVLNEFGEPKYAPRNLNEAQFSMPFTVATAIVKGSVFPDVMDESILNDPDILDLSRKISIKVTPEKNELAKREGYPPVDLRIVLHDGRSYAACELYVKGHPLNPMSFEQVVKKFWKCVGVSGEQLSRDKLQRFCDNVVEMDQVSDARTVATWLQ